MTTFELPDFTAELLGFVADEDQRDSLRWYVHDGQVVFSVVCSDTFAWGCADSEDITGPDDVAGLRQAFRDAAMAAKSDETYHGDDAYGGELWCARKRGQRPMRAWYRQCLNSEPDQPGDHGVSALFDAAAPAHEPDWVRP